MRRRRNGWRVERRRYPLPLARHLAEARAVAEHTGPLVKAARDWLLAHGVQNWNGPRSLPLWLDDPHWYGMNARDTTRARAAGLVTRPLEQTLTNTLAWELARTEPGPQVPALPTKRNAACSASS